MVIFPPDDLAAYLEFLTQDSETPLRIDVDSVTEWDDRIAFDAVAKGSKKLNHYVAIRENTREGMLRIKSIIRQSNLHKLQWLPNGQAIDGGQLVWQPYPHPSPSLHASLSMMEEYLHRKMDGAAATPTAKREHIEQSMSYYRDCELHGDQVLVGIRETKDGLATLKLQPLDNRSTATPNP